MQFVGEEKQDKFTFSKLWSPDVLEVGCGQDQVYRETVLTRHERVTEK